MTWLEWIRVVDSELRESRITARITELNQQSPLPAAAVDDFGDSQLPAFTKGFTEVDTIWRPSNRWRIRK